MNIKEKEAFYIIWPVAKKVKISAKELISLIKQMNYVLQHE